MEAGADRPRDHGFAGSGGMDQGVEAIPEGTVDEFHQSGRGSPGLRVSSESIAHCRWIRRDMGKQPGSQTHLAFLPVPQTDFIFAAFAEEHGFVGALAVLLLYFIVLMRLTQNAQTAPDRAGAFLVMGVVAVLSFHILVNIGMVVGFMPVTGIPLPLMSYGGSSVLFMFLALGMVMNVRMRRFVN